MTTTLAIFVALLVLSQLVLLSMLRKQKRRFDGLVTFVSNVERRVDRLDTEQDEKMVDVQELQETVNQHSAILEEQLKTNKAFLFNSAAHSAATVYLLLRR